MNSINITSQNNTQFFYTPNIFDYFELMKPRVMSLVIFTTIAGMYLAPIHIHPVLGLFSIIAIALGAGSAGAINQWIDKDIDKIMFRTKNRPIPSGRVDPAEALTFSLVVSLISIILLGLASNWFAASLLFFTIIFYAVFYSILLKRKTPQNIVIGGAAGSFPPVIGWVAMTGDITLFPFIMFMVIFLWTPPHFWALALVKSEDYSKAKIPMMPNVVGETSTKNQMFIYSVLLFFSSVTPYVLGYSGLLYFVCALSLSFIFITLSLALILIPKKKLEMPLFGYSIFYLFGIFISLVSDKLYYSAY
mgnify:FL=1|tara:strand:+ start:126 stop:1040 length:915 start_codon:yes stop_codon:yes gene_type:complete